MREQVSGLERVGTYRPTTVRIRHNKIYEVISIFQTNPKYKIPINHDCAPLQPLTPRIETSYTHHFSTRDSSNLARNTLGPEFEPVFRLPGENITLHSPKNLGCALRSFDTTAEIFVPSQDTRFSEGV
jgi:hypothetical protein